MKYISTTLLILLLSWQVKSQNIPEKFLEGKSVVLISNAPQARPVMNWTALAQELHPALLAAGGDPVGYYELEEITISEEVQSEYATAFTTRLIDNVVICTRKASGEIALHILPFTRNKTIVAATTPWGLQAENLNMIRESLSAIGNSSRSKNLLVLEIPEFPTLGSMQTETANSFGRYLSRNPLNLDVFKLGIPLSGSGGETAVLNTFRYDRLGKSESILEAEQNAERSGMESIFQGLYPYQVEYLTVPKTDADLIKERIQFVLMRVEAREADLMESMGVTVENPEEKTDIVIKYYIKFLVRNELYIGPVWDAHPNWEVALKQFLENLKIK
jgi:hypothetical protein